MGFPSRSGQVEAHREGSLDKQATQSLHILTHVQGCRIFARCMAPAASYTPAAPVVLVHGLSASSRCMVPTAERLAVYRPVYAPDLPGFGRSDTPIQAL